MTSETSASGTSTSYAYDANGLLQSETTGSTTTDYLWNVAASVPALLSDGTNDYIYGANGSAVEQIAIGSQTPSYLLLDAAGSTRLLTDASGQVTGASTYDPWGNLAASSGTASSALGFAGQLEDGASGLLYLRARWYDPATGQFESVDPSSSSTTAPYSYAGNDPLNGGDPTGMFLSSYGGRNYCGPSGCGSHIYHRTITKPPPPPPPPSGGGSNGGSGGGSGSSGGSSSGTPQYVAASQTPLAPLSSAAAVVPGNVNSTPPPSGTPGSGSFFGWWHMFTIPEARGIADTLEKYLVLVGNDSGSLLPGWLPDIVKMLVEVLEIPVEHVQEQFGDCVADARYYGRLPTALQSPEAYWGCLADSGVGFRWAFPPVVLTPFQVTFEPTGFAP